MQPFRFDIHPHGVDRSVEIVAELLSGEPHTLLEAEALAIGATARCAA